MHDALDASTFGVLPDWMLRRRESLALVHEGASRTMRVRILRGAHEVGGNCVEVEHDGARVILDLGWPLTVEHDVDLPLPSVTGLANDDDPSLLGIVLTHPHFDHYGLLAKMPRSVRVYMGEAASRILREGAFFTPTGIDITPAGFLRHRHSLSLGPFEITAYLNDHSAFDAYSLLVEAGGRKLFYTGDLRAHGRKASLFEELVRRPPAGVNVLLMEGTHIRQDADGTERGPTEQGVEEACIETCRTAPGMVLAMYSPQNIDRLVTLYRATIRAERMSPDFGKRRILDQPSLFPYEACWSWSPRRELRLHPWLSLSSSISGP